MRYANLFDVLAFMRVSTNRRVFAKPLDPKHALDLVSLWLDEPAVTIVEPTDRHWSVFRALVEPLGTAGNLTSDAHLAALSVEHGAQLCSTDNDFARFAHLRWTNPLEA